MKRLNVHTNLNQLQYIYKQVFQILILTLLLYFCMLMDFQSYHTLAVVVGFSRAWIMQISGLISVSEYSLHDSSTKTRCKKDHGAAHSLSPWIIQGMDPSLAPTRTLSRPLQGNLTSPTFCTGSLDQTPYSRFQPDFPQQRASHCCPLYSAFFSA